MLRRLSLVALLVALVVPAVADAAKPKPTGRIGFKLVGAHEVGGKQVAVAGRGVRIEGRIVPYVEGEQVTIRVWRGHKRVKRVTLTPKPSRTGKTATFALRIAPASPASLNVFAVHEPTAAQRRLVAQERLTVVAPLAWPGSQGTFVALVQQRLAALGYAVPSTGVYDAGTERAVLAFRKVNRMERITTLTPFVVDRLLRGVGGFPIRYPGHGRHVEGNLTLQVLALIENGRVVRAYHTSSGAPATPTILGSYRFYLKTPGTNSLGMVHSSYFIRGYAIHGYVDVPTYPASHGCFRVPIPDARAIFDWVRIGDAIDVYY